jgi:hypothetical protein
VLPEVGNLIKTREVPCMNAIWVPFAASTGEVVTAVLLTALVLYDQATVGIVVPQPPPEYKFVNPTMLGWAEVGAWPVA